MHWGRCPLILNKSHRTFCGCNLPLAWICWVNNCAQCNFCLLQKNALYLSFQLVFDIKVMEHEWNGICSHAYRFQKTKMLTKISQFPKNIDQVLVKSIKVANQYLTSRTVKSGLVSTNGALAPERNSGKDSPLSSKTEFLSERMWALPLIFPEKEKILIVSWSVHHTSNTENAISNLLISWVRTVAMSVSESSSSDNDDPLWLLLSRSSSSEFILLEEKESSEKTICSKLKVLTFSIICCPLVYLIKNLRQPDKKYPTNITQLADDFSIKFKQCHLVISV